MGALKDLFFGNALFAPRQEVLRAVHLLDLDGETSRIKEIERFSGWYYSETPNQFGVAEAKLVCPEPWPVYYGCPSFIRLIQDNGQYVLVRRAKGEGQNTQVAVAMLVKHFERLYYELGEGEDFMGTYDLSMREAALDEQIGETKRFEARIAARESELKKREENIEQRHQKIAAEQEAWRQFKDGVTFGEWLKKNTDALSVFDVKIPQPPSPMVTKGQELPETMHRDYAAGQGFPSRPGDGSVVTTSDGAVYEFKGGNKQTWVRRERQYEGCSCGHGVSRWELHASHCAIWKAGTAKSDAGLPF
jgi:hypothetical protein